VSPPIALDDSAALIVIDVQQGFDDAAWGPRDNPAADTNIARLLDRWTETRRPIVVVHHDSGGEQSPLHPAHPGNALKPYVASAPAALSVSKTVNSAFYGEPDLHEWLSAAGISQVVIAGIQTNMCCETTARMAGNLGYDVVFVPDAMHTFDLEAPDGVTVPAAELSRITAINLSGGGFARLATTDQLTR
jgi:nicotinamidase-related amidase